MAGQTLGETIAEARVTNRAVIRPLEEPFLQQGGPRVLGGNLAPDGAIVKAAGGPIAALRDGDLIRIDLHAGTLDVELTPEEIEQRLREAVPPKRIISSRWLRRYRSLVTSANQGAVPRELEPDFVPEGSPRVGQPAGTGQAAPIVGRTT